MYVLNATWREETTLGRKINTQTTVSYFWKRYSCTPQAKSKSSHPRKQKIHFAYCHSSSVVYIGDYVFVLHRLPFTIFFLTERSTQNSRVNIPYFNFQFSFYACKFWFINKNYFIEFASFHVEKHTRKNISANQLACNSGMTLNRTIYHVF